jgi:hypothetical protein
LEYAGKGHIQALTCERALSMTASDFKSSLSGAAPAPSVSPPLAALWWAAKGHWDKAHAIVQGEEGLDAAWVHAYLHRIEGDLGNAGYWYRRAGKPAASGPVESEWDSVVSALLRDKQR